MVQDTRTEEHAVVRHVTPPGDDTPLYPLYPVPEVCGTVMVLLT